MKEQEQHQQHQQHQQQEQALTSIRSIQMEHEDIASILNGGELDALFGNNAFGKAVGKAVGSRESRHAPVGPE